MRTTAILAGLAGVGLGVLASLAYMSPAAPLRAANADRYQDYVLCTGAVTINPRVQTDGVWMLDYRSGKLLGTVVDKSQGKIMGWAEVSLPEEFGVQPKDDVHFVMTTGHITQGQSALYVAETTTGKFGIYTMGPGVNGQGIVIRRHEMTSFRQVQSGAVVPASAPAATLPPAPAPATPAPLELPSVPLIK
jgi:hypothetical protein